MSLLLLLPLLAMALLLWMPPGKRQVENLKQASVGEIYRLYSIIMHDGSRHFSDLPQTVDWYEFRDYISETPDYTLTNFITDHVTEAWIDFDYKCHHFSVNTQ